MWLISEKNDKSINDLECDAMRMWVHELIECIGTTLSQSSLTTHATHVADEISLTICALRALIALIFALFLLLCMFGKPGFLNEVFNEGTV